MKPCSASSIRPTPRSNPASRSSAPSRPIPIRRSSIRWRRPRPRSRRRADYLAFLRSIGGQDHPREIRLQVPGQPDRPDVFEISPTEWTAILLSLRVAIIATLVATPFGIALAWLLARRDFWGKSMLDAAGASAAGAAAGRHRLSAAAHLRPARPGRRVAGRPSRHRVRVSLDRRGARLRHHVVSAAGAADPAVDRGDRPPAGTGGEHARRRAVAGVRDRDAAAGAAGRTGRHGARLCQGDRRVRRHHHLRVQHSRRNPDHFLGDLFADPDAGRRYRGGAAGDRSRS